MNVNVTSNVPQVLKDVDKATRKACIKIGGKAEKYAKALCPVGTPESTGKKGYRGSTLRNSITHDVEGSTVTIGSNVEYAPYVELGTGPNFTPPPEWEHFDVPPAKGIGHSYVKPRPYLRPAVADHLDEFMQIFEDELKNATSI